MHCISIFSIFVVCEKQSFSRLQNSILQTPKIRRILENVSHFLTFWKSSISDAHKTESFVAVKIRRIFTCPKRFAFEGPKKS